MGISSLATKDGAAFVVCNLLGFLLASMLPHGTLAIVVSILISYHLFLTWLLISADRTVGVSLPIFSTIFTHACCMAVVVALPFARHAIPLFSLIRFGASYLAKFERDWLFRAETKQPKPKVETIPLETNQPASTPIVTAYVPITGMLDAHGNASSAGTAAVAEAARADSFAPASIAASHSQSDDHEEWIRYLRQPIRTYRKPGVTLQEENRLWLLARARGKPQTPAANASDTAANSV